MTTSSHPENSVSMHSFDATAVQALADAQAEKLKQWDVDSFRGTATNLHAFLEATRASIFLKAAFARDSGNDDQIEAVWRQLYLTSLGYVNLLILAQTYRRFEGLKVDDVEVDCYFDGAEKFIDFSFCLNAFYTFVWDGETEALQFLQSFPVEKIGSAENHLAAFWNYLRAYKTQKNPDSALLDAAMAKAVEPGVPQQKWVKHIFLPQVSIFKAMESGEMTQIRAAFRTALELHRTYWDTTSSMPGGLQKKNAPEGLFSLPLMAISRLIEQNHGPLEIASGYIPAYLKQENPPMVAFKFSWYDHLFDDTEANEGLKKIRDADIEIGHTRAEAVVIKNFKFLELLHEGQSFLNFDFVYKQGQADGSFHYLVIDAFCGEEEPEMSGIVNKQGKWHSQGTPGYLDFIVKELADSENPAHKKLGETLLANRQNIRYFLAITKIVDDEIGPTALREFDLG